MSFPRSFPHPFGGSGGSDAYSPVLPAVPGTDLAWISSHCEEGKALLLAQFRGKPRLEALLCALLDEVQHAEDAAWSVLTERGIDYAVGVQLDGIGQIVDLPRAGWLDDAYRRLLRAQILTLRSGGTQQDILRILVAIGIDLDSVDYDEPGTAAFRVVLGDELADVTGGDVFGFLERARAGGVRLLLEHLTGAPADAFTLSATSSPVVDHFRGWGDASAPTDAGYLASVLASSEVI